MDSGYWTAGLVASMLVNTALEDVQFKPAAMKVCGDQKYWQEVWPEVKI